MYQAEIVEKSRSKLFGRESSKNYHISNNVKDTAERDKSQIEI